MSLKEWFNRLKENNPTLEQLQEKIKQFLRDPPQAQGSHSELRGEMFGPPSQHMNHPRPPGVPGHFGAFPPGPSPLFGPDPSFYPPEHDPEFHGGHIDAEEKSPFSEAPGKSLQPSMDENHSAPPFNWTPVFPPGPQPVEPETFGHPSLTPGNVDQADTSESSSRQRVPESSKHERQPKGSRIPRRKTTSKKRMNRIRSHHLKNKRVRKRNVRPPHHRH